MQKTNEIAFKEALEAMKAYHNVAHRNMVADFTDSIYFFFEQERWEDNVWEYEHTALRVMEALIKPEVNQVLTKAIGENGVAHLGEVLWRLQELCKSMKEPANHDYLEEWEMEQYFSGEKASTDSWIKMKDEYKRKLHAHQILKTTSVEAA